MSPTSKRCTSKVFTVTWRPCESKQHRHGIMHRSGGTDRRRCHLISRSSDRSHKQDHGDCCGDIPCGSGRGCNHIFHPAVANHRSQCHESCDRPCGQNLHWFRYCAYHRSGSVCHGCGSNRNHEPKHSDCGGRQVGQKLRKRCLRLPPRCPLRPPTALQQTPPTRRQSPPRRHGQKQPKHCRLRKPLRHLQERSVESLPLWSEPTPADLRQQNKLVL